MDIMDWSAWIMVGLGCYIWHLRNLCRDQQLRLDCKIDGDTYVYRAYLDEANSNIAATRTEAMNLAHLLGIADVIHAELERTKLPLAQIEPAALLKLIRLHTEQHVKQRRTQKVLQDAEAPDGPDESSPAPAPIRTAVRQRQTRPLVPARMPDPAGRASDAVLRAFGASAFPAIGELPDDDGE